MATGVEATARPPAPLVDHHRYLGTFGTRAVTFDGQSLWIRQERRMGRRLAPLGDDRFTFADAPGTIVVFTGDKGRASAIEIAQPGGIVQTRLERSGG